MARNQKDSTYDHQMLLKAAGAVTATGTGPILDLGPARTDLRVLIDVTAIDTTSNDESYILQVQVSNSPTFANTIVAVASKQLGTTAATANSAATVAGRYEIACADEENGVVYRFLRVRWVIAGTTPSINFLAYAVKGTT